MNSNVKEINKNVSHLSPSRLGNWGMKQNALMLWVYDTSSSDSIEHDTEKCCELYIKSVGTEIEAIKVDKNRRIAAKFQQLFVCFAHSGQVTRVQLCKRPHFNVDNKPFGVWLSFWENCSAFEPSSNAQAQHLSSLFTMETVVSFVTQGIVETFAMIRVYNVDTRFHCSIEIMWLALSQPQVALNNSTAFE